MDFDRIEKALDELELNSKKLNGYTEIYSELSILKDSMANNDSRYKVISDDIEDSSKRLGKSIEDTKSTNKILLDKLDSFYQENRNHRVNLDNLITSELKKNTSDLSVEIRQENSHLLMTIDNSINMKFNSQQSDITKQMDKQHKFASKLMIVSIFNIIVCICIFVFLFMK